MAQWTGQFTGVTHDTKVRDIEISLRKAVEALSGIPEDRRAEKLKAIRSLAERLRAARLKALRARISALTEPGCKSLGEVELSHLREREQDLEVGGIEGVLKEFGL